jgi:hypothetical protein
MMNMSGSAGLSLASAPGSGEKGSSMRHPFKVGEHYRNRDGSYEVVRIDEPNMLIRYADGRELETPIAVQNRIWENMQIEEEYPQADDDIADEPRRVRTTHSSPKKRPAKKSPS